MRVGTEPHSSEPGTEEISQDSSFFKAALVALSNPEIPSAFLLPMYLFFSFHVCKETPEIQQVKKKKKKDSKKKCTQAICSLMSQGSSASAVVSGVISQRSTEAISASCKQQWAGSRIPGLLLCCGSRAAVPSQAADRGQVTPMRCAVLSGTWGHE